MCARLVGLGLEIKYLEGALGMANVESLGSRHHRPRQNDENVRCVQTALSLHDYLAGRCFELSSEVSLSLNAAARDASSGVSSSIRSTLARLD